MMRTGATILFLGLFLGLTGNLAAQTPAVPAPATPDTMTEVPVEETQPGSPKGEHELGTEEIRGQERLKIEDLKPPFFPMIDPYEPINSVLRTERYIFDDHLFATLDSISVPSHYLHSSYLRTPVVDRLIRGDVLVFLPKFEKNVANWELTVSNSLGQTVRRVKRKGNPPNIITWDGRDDEGIVINTGETYDFTFFAYDAIGNQTRIPGRPQRVSGMLSEDAGEWVVSVAADGIFENRGTRLVPGAERWLAEMANAVKEKFKSEAVVYVYTDREDLSTERAKVMVAELSGRVKFSKDAIKSAPRFVPGLQPKYSKVEVRVR